LAGKINENKEAPEYLLASGSREGLTFAANDLPAQIVASDPKMPSNLNATVKATIEKLGPYKPTKTIHPTNYLSLGPYVKFYARSLGFAESGYLYRRSGQWSPIRIWYFSLARWSDI